MTEAARRLSTEELLSHASWLQALALQLAREADAAQDAVQETWVAALEGPRPAPARARAWLASVLRNALRQRQRSEGARGQRERAVAVPEASPSASDVVSRAQGQRVLVEAVLALSEPLRTTVLRRYFDGISSADIAREQGLPQSTVRNRLKRALGELRAGLERGERGELLSVLALCALPQRPDLVTTTTLLILMSTTTKLVALTLFLVLASLAYLSFGGGAPQDAPELAIVRAELETLEPAAPPVLEGAGELTPRAAISAGENPALDEPLAAASDEPLAEERELPPGELEVLVLVNGTPATEGWVHLMTSGRTWLPDDPWGSNEELQRLGIDGEGRAHFRGLSAGSLVVGAELRGGAIHQRRLNLAQDVGARVVITLGTGSVFGRVFDPQGQLVVGARISLYSRIQKISTRTLSDSAGRYRLKELDTGAFFGSVKYEVAGTAELVDFQLNLTLEQGEERELDFGRAVALPVWRGTVRTSSGEPVSNFPGGMGRRSSLHLTRLDDKTYASHDVESDGNFALRLEPGRYHVLINAASNTKRLPLFDELEIAEAGLDLDVVLPGTRVHGVLRDAGRPFEPQERSKQTISLYRSVRSAPTYTCKPQGAGRYCLDGVEPGLYVVKGWPWSLPEGIEILVEEQAREVSLDLELLPH